MNSKLIHTIRVASLFSFLSLLLCPSVGAVQQLFEARVDYEVGFGLGSICAADFDNDGDIDLAASHEYREVVVVLWNDGDGLFSVVTEHDIYRPFYSVVAEDLNHDGHTDIVISSDDFDSLAILINQGGGVFAPVTYSNLGIPAVGLKTADIDGDNNPDAIVSNEDSSQVAVSLGNGDGTFAPPIMIDARETPGLITLGDFDSDGLIDLAVTCFGPDSVYLLFNNGDSSFSAPVALDLAFEPGNCFAHDLDNDGNSDLAIINDDDDCPAVIMNNGDGSFAPAVQYPHVNEYADVWRITCFDINGDSYADIVTAGFLTQMVMINNGDGTFTPAQALVPSGYSLSILGADFDGDGHSELAAACPIGGWVSVWKNNTTGRFVAGSNFYAGLTQRDMSLADYDGDNDLDLTVCLDDYGLLAMYNDGNGGFDDTQTWDYDFNASFHINADLDGDNDMDLVVVAARNWYEGDSLWFVFNDGSGDFSETRYSGVSGVRRLMSAADFDNDGLVDLALTLDGDSIVMMLNNGDTTFTRTSAFAVDSNLTFLLAADHEGDNDTDLILTSRFSATVHVFRNDGAGTFAADPYINAEWSGGWLEPADVDDDGDLDMIVAKPLYGVTVWRNEGSGSYVRIDSIGFYKVTSSVQAADYDGDGDCDFAVNLHDENVTRLFLNNGDGDFEPDLGYGTLQFPIRTRAADLDDDGDIDLVTSHQQSDSIIVIKNRSDLITSIGEPSGHDILPRSFYLSQNYPNPFNPATRITFALPSASHVKLEVYNILGRKATTLIDKHLPPGNHTAMWDGTDYATGVYFYRLKTEGFAESRKMVLVR